MTRTRPLRPGRRLLRTSFAALGAAALALAGCASAEPATAPVPAATVGEIVTGGVAEVATGAEMPGFDPIKVRGVGAGTEKVAQVLDFLMDYDEVSGEITPRLAESMVSDDGITWVMTLREGVTFTDGEPLDAEAVLFNLQRHIAPDSVSAAKATLAPVQTMEATGAYEVTFVLAQASGSFPLAFTWASSAGLIGSPKALADPDAFNTSPVGAGPFKVESWTPDDELVLTRNDDYWDEGKPYLDGLVFRVLPDLQTRADELVSGTIDSALVPSIRWNAIGASPNVKIVPVEGIAMVIVPNASKGAGADERVRTAMAMTLSGETTAQVLFGGTEYWDGDTTCLPWATGSPICVEGSVYEQDLAEAKELVADYVADGGDPTMTMTYHQGLVDQATYYQQQFTEIGLDIVLEPVDIAAYFQAEATGTYDIFVGSGGYPYLFSRLHSGSPLQWGRVAYPELDELLMHARDDLTLDERNKAWSGAVEFLHDNAVLQWTAPYTSGVGYSTSLRFGDEDAYKGTLIVYFDDAWLSSES
ncbi:ABC transporter substrate-binding protein [Microbacterium sp. zg-Y818]|uniref:ABC transporter substrate-binding protein n=1 Tax=unclassified Microbacterium TaxID=2609290 RepID=UPI00214AB4FB|nr:MULTISPECIES: ABC transporter substrate-binding protein [unclassified Microbacterium]MCR2799382.1 ABC transporter substrate-binding protein [Microbacterium sp. zg.Y818]WIM21381.1 ABC transporter substrate-binding protein [Microbacterium sp. zg-Y818]